MAEFLDFKRRVWYINHQTQPPPASWFQDSSGNEDDDIVLDHETQSLKCPITLVILDKPVRNATCPHVYSLDAIRELVRHGNGMCKCPVAGCGAMVTMSQVREDKVMARKIRIERAREEENAVGGGRAVEEVVDGPSDNMYDDIKVEGSG